MSGDLTRQDGIFPFIGQGVCALLSSPRKFSARPSHKKQEGRAQISKTRERSGRQAVPEQRGPKGWRGVLVWCPPMLLIRAICSLMVKEKLNNFSPRPLTEAGGRATVSKVNLSRHRQLQDEAARAHGVRCLTSAFKMTISLRMHAVSAILGVLPASRRRR
jgi:hypothetical protein